MKKVNIQRQQGFTLIELMIVIAIVGILAAIALPAYQDYTVRARLSEALAVAAEGKTSISEFSASRGALPGTALSAGISLTGFGATSYVASQAFTGSGQTGVYQITLAANPQLGAASGLVIELAATREPNGRVTWICGSNPTTGTTVPAKFLPGSCRGL